MLDTIHTLNLLFKINPVAKNNFLENNFGCSYFKKFKSRWSGPESGSIVSKSFLLINIPGDESSFDLGFDSPKKYKRGPLYMIVHHFKSFWNSEACASWRTYSWV